jgi:hypothetical protein
MLKNFLLIPFSLRSIVVTAMLLFVGNVSFSQVRPDQAPTKSPADTDEIYTQYLGVLNRIKFSDAKVYFQSGLSLSWNSTTNELTIGGGNTVDISSLNTDDQQLTRDGLILSLENGGSVDLSPLFSGIDDQTLSFNSATGELTIQDGNTVDLSALGSNGSGTDDQIIDVFSLAGTTLSLSLENDGQATQTVDLSSLQDGTGTDDQTIDVFNLIGTTLSLSLENDGLASQTVDLSSLQDGTGTDDQTSVEVSHTPSGDLASSNVGAALNEIQTQVSAIQTLTGRSDGDANFGTLTGTLLPDNSDAVTIFNTVDNELLKLQPITESITSGSTTMTLYGGNRYNKYHIIDMTSASTSVAVVVTMSTSAILSASTHTFHFQNTATGQEVTFPSTFLKIDGTQIGTKAIETDQQFTCYFDGTSLYCETE